MPAVILGAPGPVFVDPSQGTPGAPSPTAGVMAVQGVTGAYPIAGVMGITGPVAVSNLPAVQAVTGAVGVIGPVGITGPVIASQGTGAALAGKWPVQVTDGTNVMPTMDVAARAAFHKLTDGVSTVAVKGAGAGAIPADPAFVITASPNSVPLAVYPGLPGSTDVHGSTVVVSRVTQIHTKFFQQAPSAFLNITTTGTASATQGTGVAVFATGAGTTSQVLGQTFATVNYASPYEAWCSFSCVFTAPTSAASYQRLGIYNTTDGFSFGYNGTTFGIWTRFNSVDTFIPQASWNKDVLSGATNSFFTSGGAPVALNPVNFNMYRIRYGWYGGTSTNFEVYAPDGNWVLVHLVRTSNSQTTPNLTTPNLPMTLDISKTASDATNLSISCGAWNAGVSCPTAGPLMSGQVLLGSSGANIVLPVQHLSALSFSILGTWVGTLSFQYSLDGVNFTRDLVLDNANGNFSSSTTINNAYTAAVASYRYYRIVFTSYTSGSASIVYNASEETSFITAATLITDASNNGPAAVTPPNVAATAIQPALVVQISPNQPSIPVTTSPINSTPSLSFGDVALTGTGTTSSVRRTAYTEQTVNFTGSVSSSSASDGVGGTGARTIKITYVDQTGATLGTESVTLNGTTPVNLVQTNKCFIEKIELVTVGSTGAAVGTISLFTAAAGGGTVVGTIGAGDRRTFWAHHYILSGKTCNITGVLHANSSTVSGGTSTAVLRKFLIGIANSVEEEISETLSVSGASNPFFRSYGSQIQVSGPARVTMYTTTGSSASITYRGSFDSYDQ